MSASSRKSVPASLPRRTELTIGALARRARVAPSVLRYYEQEGLLGPVRRSAAGYRFYGPDAERTLLFINRAKRLGLSLEDIRHDGARQVYRRLVDRVCGEPQARREEKASLRSLLKRMGCRLASMDQREVLDVLQGRHIHVWRDAEGYSVLLPDGDPRIRTALEQIAASEAGCEAHTAPQVEETAEGYVFSARGDNAFLFAQFFLALEHAPAGHA